MRPPVHLNSAEIDALYGLPHAAQVVYLLGIRPFMDNSTGLVGASNSPDKSISLQSLAEVLFVEPKQGRTGTGSRSRKQARVCVDVLIDAGLIESLSIAKKHEKRLIFKCVLAGMDSSIQENQGTNRAHYQGTNRAHHEPSNSNGLSDSTTIEQGTPETLEQGTPQTDSKHTDRQTSRARVKTTIPVPFEIDEQMQAMLVMSGISMRQAQFMLVYFVDSNTKSKYLADNWRREFIDYIRRFSWRWEQHKKQTHLVPVPAVGAGKDVFNGFITSENFDDDGQ